MSDLIRRIGVSALAICAASAAEAQTSTFDLGRIEEVTVTGQQRTAQPAMSQGLLSSEDIYKFNVLTLDRAIDLVPGAVAVNSGGPRNEQLIYVRGFDRFQVPISIDGIRVYLPADNRLDFGLFLTADLSEIQVQKGYASVLDGPGALGGAINLVTRKPTKEFEWEARSGINLGGDGSLDGTNGYARFGMREDKFYIQGSFAITEQSRWTLSDNFTPTATENGGFRDHSETRNWRVNAKAGFTPNDTDEYSLSYTTQSGRKDAPFSVSDPVASQRDWSWPYWDIDSIYFLSTTALGTDATLKTRVYYNTFSNGLFAWDNANYNTQTLPKAFRSYYEDRAWGGSVEGDKNFGTADILKAAFFYRRDSHTETETVYGPRYFVEPNQNTDEDTYSAALENRYRLTPKLDVVAGVSYDWRHLLRAQDYVDPTATVPGSFILYPLADGHAWNFQGALIYALTDTANLYANVSDRTRFPTIFDRFSTRFGGAASNPDLRPERATNWEIGGGDRWGATKFNASIYYSQVTDAIESVNILFNGTAVTQSQNVGSGHYYGAEFSADTALLDQLDGGVRFSFEQRFLHYPASGAFRQTGVPTDQVFVYLTWTPLQDLSLTPSFQASSNRWTATTDGLRYYRTGSFAIFNLEADYRVTNTVDVSFGGRNLFDRNYTLTAGFPEQGRSLFVNVRVVSD